MLGQRSSRTADAEFVRYWAALTAGGAVGISVVEGFLLQRSKSFFTGGFLSTDYLAGPGEIAAFLCLSLMADAAVVGATTGFIIWLLTRSRFSGTTTAVAALLGSVGPLVVFDVISYELASYVGDLFDPLLALELAGGNVVEILTVASSHLLMPGLLILGAGGAAGGLVWLAHRYSKNGRPIRCATRGLRIPALAVAAGVVATTIGSANSDSFENGLLRKPSAKMLLSIADALSDVDGDGFGIAGRMADPDLFDGSVFPYGLDLPENGIDEDGVGGDLPARIPLYTEPHVRPEPWSRRPDVVLVVLESFRADLVGSRYNGQPVTPVLDALAARGASTMDAYSHSGYTAPSRYHLLSGSLAGVRDGRSLIDDFNANGYLVGYFSGQDESFTGPEHNVGFERADVFYDARVDRNRRYSTFTTAGSLAVPLGIVQERVNEFLRDRAHTTEPMFLYVNFHDTHFPYGHERLQTITSPVRLPRGAIRPNEREALWATYANTAANVDRAIGDVLQAMEHARGARPAVIVTADHGESLFDEGFLGHGYALNDVQTRIPLVVADLPMIIEEPFAQSDLRDALGIALRTSPDAPSVPRVRELEGKEVFQYLGNLHRPRQIAFLRKGGRSIYDFRSGRVQLRNEPWRRSTDLVGPDGAEFLRLINEWERMMLARQSTRNRN